MKDKDIQFKFLRIDKHEDDSIFILTIDHPPANTLSLSILDEMDGAFNLFDSDANTKILILTGSGDRAFCAGADVNEIMNITSPENGILHARRGQDLCNKIENSDKPVIAAINALCLGGGNEIATACHIRIASERAKFAQPEINLGIIPGFGGTQRLARLIGLSRARKLILTGDMITAKEAFEFGLVDEVVEQSKVLSRAIELAKRITRNGQAGVRLAQKALREGYRKSLSEGLELELECFGKICETEDMKEGLSAFKEKRPPIFKNQ